MRAADAIQPAEGYEEIVGVLRVREIANCLKVVLREFDGGEG
jgi:hypothetical protein